MFAGSGDNWRSQSDKKYWLSFGDDAQFIEETKMGFQVEHELYVNWKKSTKCVSPGYVQGLHTESSLESGSDQRSARLVSLCHLMIKRVTSSCHSSGHFSMISRHLDDIQANSE